MKTWKFEHEGATIEVINSASGEKLSVNGQLQDEQIGYAARSRLYGHLLSPNGERRNLKVSIGAEFLTIRCIVFLDDKEIYRS